MATEWNFGIQTPESGFLVFAPGVIGINATAETGFGSRGFLRELYLETKGDIQNEPAELKKKRLPYLFRRGKDTKFEVQVTFTASNTITRSYDVNNPYELEIKTEIPQTADGKVTGFGFSLTRSIDNQIIKVPLIGAKLFLLAKLGVLTHTATIHGFAGIIADITFRTPRPPQLPDAGTTQPADDLRANRRHMFGGSIVSASFAPQMGFGAKVTSTVVGEVLQAEIGLKLTGNKKAGREFAEIRVNPLGDWPWITRISGSLNLDLAARVNVYVWEGMKSYSWPFLHWDFQFGTESVFELTPVTINQSRIMLGDTGPATFEGDATQALTNGSPLSHFALAPASTPLLLLTEYNSNTSLVDLKASRRSGTGWAASETVGSAGAISSVSTLVLPDGKVLIAWSQIPEASMGLAFASSEIHYVVEQEGGGWSAPALASSLTGTAIQLFPIMTDSWSGLVVIESAEGPGGDLLIKGLPWNGSSFGAIQMEGAARECLALAATGAGDKGYVFCINENGLTEISWDGLSFTAGTVDDTITQGPVAATSDNSGNLYRATTDGVNITIDGFGENTAQLTTGPSNMKLAYLPDGTTPSVLLAWAEGGSLFAAFFNPETGALLSPIETLTESSLGNYSRLEILPGTGGNATILARYREGDLIELREIEISVGGSTNLNDSDGDGLNDLAELRIIDANTEDEIRTLADVRGSDDFDFDGDDNSTEIAMGTDPTESSLVLPDNDLGIMTLVYTESGQLSVTITSFPGDTYTLQSSTLNSAWTDEETKVATNVLLTFTKENASIGEIFYRIGRQ
ncbi:MAG: hypothetical protein O7C75_21605 [Verrucomicrobia bacterium]|nr:hypothetical protein [Verrucomicrobiota bacterium]